MSSSESAPSVRVSSPTKITSAFYGDPESYPPYTPNGDMDKGTDGDLPRVAKKTEPAHQPRVLSFYRSVSWILGFRDKYSLLNCFIWGGALVGFSLARSVTMNPGQIAHLLTPGEWFWFRQPLYKANLFLHIYFSTLAGIFAFLQFLPAIRRRKVILHRLNGYGVLFSLLVSSVCGGILGRRSFGGELNVQAAYYILSIMVVFAGCVGIYNVKKDTRRHRKWMLRMVSYFATVITARLIMLAAREIISNIGTYYSIWRCDEILNLIGNTTSFPQCTAPGADPATVWTAVHASMHDGPLYSSSSVRAVDGMALWVAMLIHIAGVEVYINKTESSNQVRLGYALEPLEANGPSGSY